MGFSPHSAYFYHLHVLVEGSLDMCKFLKLDWYSNLLHKYLDADDKKEIINVYSMPTSSLYQA